MRLCGFLSFLYADPHKNVMRIRIKMLCGFYADFRSYKSGHPGQFVTKCTVLLLMYGIVRFREKMCTVCTVILDYIYVRYCTVIIDHLLIETISGNSL